MDDATTSERRTPANKDCDLAFTNESHARGQPRWAYKKSEIDSIEKFLKFKQCRDFHGHRESYMAQILELNSDSSNNPHDIHLKVLKSDLNFPLVLGSRVDKAPARFDQSRNLLKHMQISAAIERDYCPHRHIATTKMVFSLTFDGLREATLDRSNVYRWYKMFSEGREDVNDEELAGRPSTSTTDEKINEVEKMILANRRITVREIAENLNISTGSCHSIFINDLGMRRVAAKFVPKLLNSDQKQHRMNIANEMLDSVRDDPNLL
ncbi:hypothetical protein LAZ67_20001589 [Cordylochernes scorpioides]|uniref:Mos1 transposase HTH domain-containing protein n=1 Tax=Cordylochernes scorpioides TaxID=51811 RepID=A0ABY6LK32_9ARAC|nr:hypothetical protein LAZ67_20001589 [Cordylochernes scorpioides]